MIVAAADLWHQACLLKFDYGKVIFFSKGGEGEEGLDWTLIFLLILST